jgi:hypothetical protein
MITIHWNSKSLGKKFLVVDKIGNLYHIYKIFNSIDVKDKKSLLNIVNVYSEGFFGQNEDYSANIDRLELDIIKAMEGGCQEREKISKDPSKRIVHPKARNNNCFFKCIQPLVPQLREKILKSECNKIREEFELEDNCMIDVGSALRIFEKFSHGQNGLEIWTDETDFVLEHSQ